MNDYLKNRIANMDRGAVDAYIERLGAAGKLRSPEGRAAIDRRNAVGGFNVKLAVAHLIEVATAGGASCWEDVARACGVLAPGEKWNRGRVFARMKLAPIVEYCVAHELPHLTSLVGYKDQPGVPGTDMLKGFGKGLTIAGEHAPADVDGLAAVYMRYRQECYDRFRAAQ